MLPLMLVTVWSGTPSTTVSDYTVIEYLLLIVCPIFRKDSSAVVNINLRVIQQNAASISGLHLLQSPIATYTVGLQAGPFHWTVTNLNQ